MAGFEKGRAPGQERNFISIRPRANAGILPFPEFFAYPAAPWSSTFGRFRPRRATKNNKVTLGEAQ
jgi:hypothetical protein